MRRGLHLVHFQLHRALQLQKFVFVFAEVLKEAEYVPHGLSLLSKGGAFRNDACDLFLDEDGGCHAQFVIADGVDEVERLLALEVLQDGDPVLVDENPVLHPSDELGRALNFVLLFLDG